MSESAVILEGEVARRFNPVDKLRATNQDSSVSDWVPSDTLDLGSLMASENTLYMANIDDDCDAYEEVEVDVSEELEDGDYKKITGKGNDGNDYAVGLDENGNLTSEMVPSAIHIVIKPRKLEYEEGETLDFTGIHVYLMDGNNQRFTSEDYPTGEIPFEELVFPVTVAEGGGEETKSYDIDSNVLDNKTGYQLPLIASGSVEYSEDWITNKVTAPATIVIINYSIYAFAESPFTMVLEEELTSTHEPHYYYFDSAPVTTLVSHKTVYCATGLNVEQTLIRGGTVSGYLNFVNKGNVYKSDIATILFDGIETDGSKSEIPVQWMRSDGDILEDTFKITVSGDDENNTNSGTSDSGSGHTSGGF